MASQETSKAPADARVLADDERQSMTRKDEAYMKVEDLEGRLRGLILKNSSSPAANATTSAQINNTSFVSPVKNVESVPVASDEIISGKHRRLQPEKEADPSAVSANSPAASPSPRKRSRGGQALNSGDQYETSRGRRRPNQVQRRQMGTLDLQSPPSTPSQDTRQLKNQVHPPKANRPQQSPMQDMPRSSDAPSSLHAPVLQPSQPNPSRQHYPKQQQTTSTRASGQMPHYHTDQSQNARLARGNAHHPGSRGSVHPRTPTQNSTMSRQYFRCVSVDLKGQPFEAKNVDSDFVYSNRSNQMYPPHMANNSRNSAGEYTRPVATHGQLYNADAARSTYQQRSAWSVVPDIAAQNEFLHRTGEVEYNKARIPVEELQEKEDLRLKLQKICAEAIMKYEISKNPGFDAQSVSLACFGSLRSGFATRGSDMDLALVSPASSPDPASAESEIPRILEKALLDLGYGARLLTKTRVPIIRFCENPTPEILEALRENRAKWEKDKDAPSKPKKKEKKVSTQDQRHTIQHDVREEAKQDKKPKSGNANADQAAVGDIVPNTEVLSEDDPKILETHGNGHDRATIQQEDGEKSGVYRSDDELIYLYKLAIKEGWFEHPEKLLIIKFVEAVKTHGADGDHKDLVDLRLRLKTLPDVLSRYRVPPESHLDYPKTGVGIQCDINFSNHLALHNTRLLKCYSLCDPRVQPMIIVVKAWAKSRKINSSYHGTLSSYGYVLMALHYLMNIVQPPIIPNLQLLAVASSPENDSGLNGYSVRFWQSEQDIVEAARRGQLTWNHEATVGSLLRGFFQYYAHPFRGGFSWPTDVLSLRTPGGILRKEDKGWTGAKTETVESTVPGEDAKEVRHRYLFAIEDPFEVDHNVARTVVHNGIVAIRDEFRRAVKIIQSRGSGKAIADDDLFAEAASKEHLQRRFFGPLVKPFGARVYKENAAGTPNDGKVPETDKTKADSTKEAPSGEAGGDDVDIVVRSLADTPYDQPRTPVSSTLKAEDMDMDERHQAKSSTPDTEASSFVDENVVDAGESNTINNHTCSKENN